MPSTKQTYTVNVFGQEFSRHSHNEYTHVVVRHPRPEVGGGDVVAWSGSEANARKAMRHWQGWCPDRDFEVRPIEETQWSEENGVLTISI
jgi:hypothetical protein